MNRIIYNKITLNIPKRYYIKNLLNRFKQKKYEKDEEKLIINLNQNDVVLELGACLGYLSIVIAKKVKNIVSIEANPELIAALNKTKEDNKIDNLYFTNCIVDNKDSEKLFYTYNLIVAGSADRDDKFNPKNCNKKKIKKYNVNCTTIDNLEKEYNLKFNTLFIDIEGGELIFIQQNLEYIKQNINKIIIELHGRFMKDKNFNKKCIDLLNYCGLKIKNKNGGVFYFTR